jgi:hypothetical protein
MHYGRKQSSALHLQPPALESDPKLKLAMESMDQLIREAKANRTKVKELEVQLERFTRQR